MSTTPEMDENTHLHLQKFLDSKSMKSGSLKFSTLLLLLCFLSLVVVVAHAQQLPGYLGHVCSRNATFPFQNSTYNSNLNLLLTSLSSNSTNGFSTSSSGQEPNIVYGMFLCRGDVGTTDCQNCVRIATEEIVQRCPIGTVVVIWYDQCLLRYSNTPIVSSVAQEPSLRLVNTQPALEQARLDQLVVESMSDTAAKAVRGQNFAVKEVNFTGLTKLYTLVQCTPDLSVSDCNLCLGGAIGRLPSGSQGGRVLLPSCNVRYELYPFYNATGLASPTSSPPPSPSAPAAAGKNGISTAAVVGIVTSLAVCVVLFSLSLCLIRRRARKRTTCNTVQVNEDGNEITNAESLQFDLSTIKSATSNFSAPNKLGEGGFGQVHKGRLPNGQEIAVKRLSRSSVQGAPEFKNEVMLMAKLQHRNLVRLIGFCFAGEEKILVYEFVPNKSLDYFLFDPEKQGQLDWSKRYKIIGGVARGLLYLHEESRLRIIHRDLKASNILLDAAMNPKISDFGMARIFGVDQTQANTNRIVGTYGYMSPEYAMRGHFSVKSDAYSFGVLILEIICGKRNNSFFGSDGVQDLVSYVWKHWRDGTPLEVLDPSLVDTHSRHEAIRCIHLGLLCVQEDPANRPTMATVVLMLSSYSATMPLPQEPVYIPHSRSMESMGTKEWTESDQSRSKSVAVSVNEESITQVYPR